MEIQISPRVELLNGWHELYTPRSVNLIARFVYSKEYVQAKLRLRKHSISMEFKMSNISDDHTRLMIN